MKHTTVRYGLVILIPIISAQNVTAVNTISNKISCQSYKGGV